MSVYAGWYSSICCGESLLDLLTVLVLWRWLADIGSCLFSRGGRIYKINSLVTTSSKKMLVYLSILKACFKVLCKLQYNKRRMYHGEFSIEFLKIINSKILSSKSPFLYGLQFTRVGYIRLTMTMICIFLWHVSVNKEVGTSQLSCATALDLVNRHDSTRLMYGTWSTSSHDETNSLFQ